ncbi:amino acid ABC transporter ATP-binding protein [Oceanirhabdus sp. W0125-5]|uniref:amino acid ABC transporter ATP-binding protein n=1 Tax=Oceanirhabdus sp. W0125-5 TaxID=2999116 RepID=UPI0022F2F066|nr:amino acid ABC transporter ATP-binding protein [Oceanirhabdus sp. W0125-5]WBW96770.1 amino acid ABC transporter ATP-binding protein [Oceanirhabdus sp. W0125-5]
MIKIIDATKKFGEEKVLNGINTSFDSGQVISIVGPSGAGKSTFLRSIIQLENLDEGIIEIDDNKLSQVVNGVDKISKKDKREILLKMGMVFQNFNLFPHKTAIENVMEALLVVKKMKDKDARAIGEKMLKKVGLFNKRDSLPSQLSGGQKQRVAIARALAMEPEVILFDEPTSALDPESIREVVQVIKELAKEQITLIIVTHEKELALGVSQRVLFMENGKIGFDFNPSEINSLEDGDRVRNFFRALE